MSNGLLGTLQPEPSEVSPQRCAKHAGRLFKGSHSSAATVPEFLIDWHDTVATLQPDVSFRAQMWDPSSGAALRLAHTGGLTGRENR